MAEVDVKLGIQDKASAQIQKVSRELADLARIAKQAGSPDAAFLARGATQLKNVSNNFGQIKEEASGAAGAITTLRSAMGGFTASAGGGLATALLGLGGAVAFAAAAGKVIGDSIKLASQFEHVSQRAAFSLAIGRGNVLAQMNALQQVAKGYTSSGLSPIAATEMIASYGAASGAGVSQSINQGHSIIDYARAFGLDPSTFAGQMGVVGQYSRKGVSANAAEIFGGAQAAGDAGRRIPELLGNAVNLLTQIQAANPFGRDGLKSAMSEIVGIASLGGHFTDTGIMQNTMSGLSQIGNSLSGSPYMSRLALRSGFSIPDIMFGTQDPSKIGQLTSGMYRDSGGNGNYLASMLRNLGLSGAVGRDTYEAIMHSPGGNIMANGKYKPLSEKVVKALADQANNTPAGMLDALGARIEKSETSLGQTLIRSFLPLLNQGAKGLENLSRMFDGVDFSGKLMKMLDGFGHMIAKLAQVSTYLYDLVQHFGATPWMKKLGEGGAIGTISDAKKQMNSVLYNALTNPNQNYQGSVSYVGPGPGSSPFFIPGGVVKGTRIDRARLKQAISNLESGGDYTRSSPRANDPSYGKYQFTPDTLATMWSYDSTTKAMAKKNGRYSPLLYKYFLSHPALQEKFMDAKIDEYVRSGAQNVAEFGVAHNAGSGWLADFKRNENSHRYGYEDYPHRLVQEYEHPKHGFSDTYTDANGNVFDIKTTVTQRHNPTKTRKKAKVHRN